MLRENVFFLDLKENLNLEAERFLKKIITLCDGKGFFRAEQVHSLRVSSKKKYQFSLSCNLHIVTIDPANIKESHQLIFNQVTFLGDVFKKGIYYRTYQFDEEEKIETMVMCCFTRSFYWRMCESKRHRGQIRFEVIDDQIELGSGEYGSVRPIVATIDTSGDQIAIKQKSAGKKRVVKEVKNKGGKSEAEREAALFREYTIGKRIDYLHMKKPIITNTSAFLTMRLQEGETLRAILDRDITGESVLNFMQRMGLSRSIVEVVHEKWHKKGVVHRDLKPTNIIISNSGEARVVDAGLAKLVEESDDEVFSGTPLYVYLAPEMQFFSKGSSVASDTYALARIIAEIFRFNNDVIDKDWLKNESTQGMNFRNQLFDNLDEIPLITQQKIYALLKKMGKADPKKRISLSSALKEIENICLEFKESIIKEFCKFIFTNQIDKKADGKFFSIKKLSHQSAIEVSAARKMVDLLRGRQVDALSPGEMLAVRSGKLAELVDQGAVLGVFETVNIASYRSLSSSKMFPVKSKEIEVRKIKLQ